MVEAPGTAPGPPLLISQYVYRHSQQKLTSPLYRELCFLKVFASAIPIIWYRGDCFASVCTG